jgi:phospholipid transport system substrate-binding protein
MPCTLVSTLLAFALLVPAPAAASGEAGAKEAWSRAHADVIALVQKGAPEAHVSAKVDSLLDYRFIAQAALGGAARYAERCGDRCAEYEALVARLVRHGYLARLATHERAKVEVVGEVVRDKATKIDTRVAYVDAEGRRHVVEVAYVMHRVDGRWTVRDIVTDGVSLAKNHRYEVNRLHREGGIALVIERLRAKLAELETAG